MARKFFKTLLIFPLSFQFPETQQEIERKKKHRQQAETEDLSKVSLAMNEYRKVMILPILYCKEVNTFSGGDILVFSFCIKIAVLNHFIGISCLCLCTPFHSLALT